MSRSVFPGYVLARCDNTIRSLGGDPVALAVATGIPVDVFCDPSIPLDVDACLRFMELAASVCQCDTIGLLMGAEVDMTFLGPVWVLMQDARTLQELLQDLQRHLALFTNAISMQLVSNRDGLECVVEIATADMENDRQAVEYMLCQLTRYLRERLGTQWNSPYVQFRHRAPRSLRTHHRYFGPNVFFDSARAGFLIDTQTLKQPLINSHRGHAVIAAALKQELRLDRGHFAQRVEGVVRAIMPFAVPTQERVAQELMLSQRTLQRHLAESGTTFNAIRDKVRAQLAAKYLKQSSLSVVQIAELLGYSQSSAFCRSFARWHGTSPLKYQKDHQARAD